MEPSALEGIAGDSTLWEKEPLENLAKENQLAVFEHRGFWQAMDTLRDKNYLEELWKSGKAPWRK
jgi:glucose-1-phosphate cytidylyltransferase